MNSTYASVIKMSGRIIIAYCLQYLHFSIPAHNDSGKKWKHYLVSKEYMTEVEKVYEYQQKTVY